MIYKSIEVKYQPFCLVAFKFIAFDVDVYLYTATKNEYFLKFF